MRNNIAIGVQDFAKLREGNHFYIDKTSFIKEWWENADDVTLITRPRRFGKTLNLSMMECFFSNQYVNRGDLFEELDIWKEKRYRELQGSYPVIFLSFANIKGVTYEETLSYIKQLIVEIYGKHEYLKREGSLNEKEVEFFDSVKLDMEKTVVAASLRKLSFYLSNYYGKRVLIFLDEYDTPLQEAYMNGYWDEMISFIRMMFNSTFKTNPYMERAIMTGITRISKESIFSDLNNLEVVTTTSDKYATSFGFTESEVIMALKSFHLSENLEKLRFWYDGFCFGVHRDIYNPWSITKYLDTQKFRTYWANTSSNKLVANLLQSGSVDMKIAMEDLLEDKTIMTEVDEEIVFNQIEDSNAAVWSLLLASGYVKVVHVRESEEEDEDLYELSLTNFEVKREFRKMIRGWFDKPSIRYHDFVRALLANDIGYMNQYMNCMTEEVFSFFDSGSSVSEKTEPERFYHGFVLGLIADSKIPYIVSSNCESGLGRYDVLLEPKNRNDDAYIFEFKVYNPEKEKNLKDTVQMALAQIEERKYDTILIAKGISKNKIRHYGFAFSGKKVLIGGN